MSGEISLHAVDVAQGIPAQDMRVAVVALSEPRRTIATGVLGSGGALDHPITGGESVGIGEYEAHFQVGDWLRSRRVGGPARTLMTQGRSGGVADFRVDRAAMTCWRAGFRSLAVAGASRRHAAPGRRARRSDHQAMR